MSERSASTTTRDSPTRASPCSQARATIAQPFRVNCERLIPTDPWVQEQVIIQT